MNKLYLLFFAILAFSCIATEKAAAQSCTGFTAVCTPYESRCAATGSIKIIASGGSGNYKYKVTGTLRTNFTSVDSVTGLPAGTYIVTVSDITTNCTINISNVVVPGTYSDPRFTLNSVDVSCDNGNNGMISLATLSFGRGPFTFSIIAPSPSGVGTTNSTGTFTNLSPGVYTIRLTDSCGGIQTRLVTIVNYTWKIDSARFNKITCDSAAGYIRASDNQGNISTVTGVPGLMYGVVRSAGDTIWSASPNFLFYIGGQNTFDAVVKDNCGTIKKFPVAVSFAPSVGNTVNTFNFSCKTFSASIGKVTNFFNPRFCLTDNNGTELSCNTTGNFSNLSYGSYCINVHDSCTDTTIKRCFTATPPPAGVSDDIVVSNKVCAGFTASVTGQIGLTNPEYCLYDSASNIVACNATGVFDNLTYGSYCISIKDTCRDTTLQRCFTARKPMPVIPAAISPSYYTCTVFGLAVTGDSLTNPLFCLYDSLGLAITCNNTGVFDSLSYGAYCISVYDSCYDTTITRCMSVTGPVVSNTYTSEITNRACSTFTATVFNSGIIGPQYCLYKSSDSSLVACNSTGVFDSLAYGAYYIRAISVCPDTSFIYEISAYPVPPSLGDNVSISNRTCNLFSANISGQQNLGSPQYCLYNNADSLLYCNATGNFANLPYGDYCIKTNDACYDTLIIRCFSIQPLPVDVSVSSRKSCNYGNAIINVTIIGGVAPFFIKIIKPDGDDLFTGNYNTNNISIDNIPGLDSAQVYTVVVIDNCGGIDSNSVAVTPSIITHAARVIPKCPSSTWANGSATIETTASSNTGSVTTRITKKNGASVSISPSDVSNGVSSFFNLGPGTYIIRYKINDGCNKNQYDTVVVPQYQYPSLDRSSAYQCDHGGFSIGAVVSNGVGPFMYEIIGSTPASPSITTAPQANPVFTINNGATYSLIRLRAVDACGNATLEDASILPLANNGITTDYNCFQIATTLSVDTLYNSVYSWYKKHTEADNDSVFLGDGYSIYLPNVTPADTGLYVCHISVNTGCIKRTYYYRLDGSCYQYLPVVLKEFTGALNNGKAHLSWKVASPADIKSFIVEKKKGNSFIAIGRVSVPVGQSSEAAYSFTDLQPGDGANYYRLNLIKRNNTSSYSNILLLGANKSQQPFTIYPNPVGDAFTIYLNNPANAGYNIKLMNLYNQPVKEWGYAAGNGSGVVLSRPGGLPPGIYIIKVTDVNNNREFSQKLVFR